MNEKILNGYRGKRSYLRLLLSVALGILLCALVLAFSQVSAPPAQAEPLPGGAPKLTLSTKVVTPTITTAGNVTLTYQIRLVNTGAWTATAASLYDALPTQTTYINGSLLASIGQAIFHNGVLTWTGQVGFDSTVEITFGAKLDGAFTFGQVVNTAILSDAMIAHPITLTAVSTVTDAPILSIYKLAQPKLPGANKPMTYTLVVANQGQPAINLPITVTDWVPLSTTLKSIGTGGLTSLISDVITWTRNITLGLGQTTAFTFSVMVNNVSSGTVIANEAYQVASPDTEIAAGPVHTTTVIKPILSLSKHLWPDPPGSSRELTYTLTLLNKGSLATNLVITDVTPAGVEYRRGGAEAGGIVSWTWPKLDSGEMAEFTYTVFISDVMRVPIVNSNYAACCDEQVCVSGAVLTSVVQGPTFTALAMLDPIAKKPGGGTGTSVTATLVVRNLGPGNALSATALLKYQQISVSNADAISVTSSTGLPKPAPVDADLPNCGGGPCVAYRWTGNVNYDEIVTFTARDQSSISNVGYTTTIIISDTLANTVTTPISHTASGTVTHYASVHPYKSAPPVIGRGQLLTYTIKALNAGLSTQLPPVLTDVVPLSTTFAWASDGGTAQALTNTTVVSWILPLLSPGDSAVRTFAVRVDNDLISGTQIVNRDYAVLGYGNIATGTQTSGPPVTTTVMEVGLIDSYKQVTPTRALPGPGTILTYYLHIVNSSGLTLTNVTAYDILPWAASTYQRNAIASAGQIVSDIVTIHWKGTVLPYSSEVVTFTALVDPDFKGAITNTAIISHADLLDEVVVNAVAYITDRPELRIAKSAWPSPVKRGSALAYTINVANLGQQASGLVITDTIPTHTTLITNSITAGGESMGNYVQWQLASLKPGESRALGFKVQVEGGREIINQDYAIICAEGVRAIGEPVVTKVVGGGNIYLPLVFKNS